MVFKSHPSSSDYDTWTPLYQQRKIQENSQKFLIFFLSWLRPTNCKVIDICLTLLLSKVQSLIKYVCLINSIMYDYWIILSITASPRIAILLLVLTAKYLTSVPEFSEYFYISLLLYVIKMFHSIVFLKGFLVL